MKLPSRSAFTLIEMLTVMAVIAILASLVVAVQAFAQRKAATARADGEIHTMSASCESYKGDFGGYPRDVGSGTTGTSETDKLNPRVEGNPANYQKACLVLYKALSGDANADGKAKEKGYCEFPPNQLNKNSSGEIRFIQDPFGNSYGYSTAGAKAEEDYRGKLQTNPQEPRPTKDLQGFSPNFDLWSTGGVVNKSTKETDLDSDRKRWVKNW